MKHRSRHLSFLILFLCIAVTPGCSKWNWDISWDASENLIASPEDTELFFDVIYNRFPPQLQSVKLTPEKPVAGQETFIEVEISNDPDMTDAKTISVSVIYISEVLEWKEIQLKEKFEGLLWTGWFPAFKSGEEVDFIIKARDSKGNEFTSTLYPLGRSSEILYPSYLIAEDCVHRTTEQLNVCEDPQPVEPILEKKKIPKPRKIPDVEPPVQEILEKLDGSVFERITILSDELQIVVAENERIEEENERNRKEYSEKRKKDRIDISEKKKAYKEQLEIWKQGCMSKGSFVDQCEDNTFPRRSLVGLAADDSPRNDPEDFAPADGDIVDFRVMDDERKIYVDITVEGEVSAGTAPPPNIHVYGVGMLNPEPIGKDIAGELVYYSGAVLVYAPRLSAYDTSEYIAGCFMGYYNEKKEWTINKDVECRANQNHLVFIIDKNMLKLLDENRKSIYWMAAATASLTNLDLDNLEINLHDITRVTAVEFRDRYFEVE